MTGYHGTANANWRPHQGACLAVLAEVAENYAAEASWKTGRVFRVDLDLAGLTVVEAAAGDRDENTWAGDISGDLDGYAADVVTYDDEDYSGRSHTTYRLVSAAAVAACQVVGVDALREDDED